MPSLPPAPSADWVVDVCKQMRFNFCFGSSSSPSLAFCHTWLQPLIYTARLLAITAEEGPGQAPGGMLEACRLALARHNAAKDGAWELLEPSCLC